MDRIGIAVWVVTVTLAASAFVSLPSRGAAILVGGRTLALPVAASTAFPVLLALLAGAGTEAVVRAHPLARTGRLRLTMRFWALPVALTLIAAVVQPLASSVLYWAVGVLGFALLLGTVMFALVYSLDPQGVGYRRARTLLNLTCYAIALALFLLIPPEWEAPARSLILGGVTLLLTLELLRGTQLGGQKVGLYASVVALVVTEVTAALSLTGLSTLSSGLLLLLLFYLLVGMAWQSLLRRLNRRVVLEFAAVGLAGLILVLLFAP